MTDDGFAEPMPNEERETVASTLEEADRLRRDGRHEEAIRLLVGLLKQGAGERATVFYRLGNVYIDAGDLPRAEGAYKRAIEIEPYHANALNNLAVVYKRQKRTALFIRTYRKAMREAGRTQDARSRGGRRRRWLHRDVWLVVVLCLVAVVVLWFLRKG